MTERGRFRSLVVAPPPPPPDEDHWVYKISGEAGQLLYVGRTKAAFRRIAEHKKGRQWSREIARIDIEHYATAEEADARERELIVACQPPYNTTFKRQGRFANLAKRAA